MAEKKKSFFSKDDILAVDDSKYTTIEVPEWGGKLLRLKSWRAKERAEFLEDTYDNAGKPKKSIQHIQASILARTIIDEDGNFMFTLKETDLLLSKNAKVLDRIFEHVRILHGLDTGSAVEAEKN